MRPYSAASWYHVPIVARPSVSTLARSFLTPETQLIPHVLKGSPLILKDSDPEMPVHPSTKEQACHVSRRRFPTITASHRNGAPPEAAFGKGSRALAGSLTGGPAGRSGSPANIPLYSAGGGLCLSGGFLHNSEATIGNEPHHRNRHVHDIGHDGLGERQTGTGRVKNQREIALEIPPDGSGEVEVSPSARMIIRTNTQYAIAEPRPTTP
jgi:hypothetical protein